MAVRHGLTAAAAAALTLFALFALVIPAQAAAPRWVRGTTADCASPVAVAEDAAVRTGEARFICIQNVGGSISRIDFQIDGRPAATERYAPYSLQAQVGWFPKPDVHVLRARVVDRNGSVRSHYLTLSVTADTRGEVPPAVPTPAPPSASTVTPPTVTPPTTTAPPTTASAGPSAPTSSAPPPVSGLPSTGSWPGPTNTGVPPGTALTRYDGPCDIRTPNVVIDAKIVGCDGMLIYAPGVVIRRSKVNGPVRTNSDDATLRVEDSEIDGRNDQSEAVGYDHLVILRSNIYGNQHTVHCGDDCRIEDSWLHDQFDGKSRGWHQNGFLTNGGSNIVLRHNTVHCRGGCTADIALIPDGDINNVLVENNLLVASPDSAYCLYAGSHSGNKPGSASNITIRDNVVQRGANNRCATYGPVTYFRPGSGNQWINNRWSDGQVLQSAD